MMMESVILALVYKLSVLVFFSAMTASHSAIADEQSKHSLGFGWSTFDDTIVGQNNALAIKPEAWSLDYSYRFNTDLSVSAYYSQSSDESVLANGALIERENDSITLGLSYALGNDFHLLISTVFQEQDTELAPNRQALYFSEEVSYQELTVSLEKDIFTDAFLFTPSLDIAYSLRETTILQNFLFRQEFGGRPLLVDSRFKEDEEGLAAIFGVSTSYYYPVTEAFDVLPTASLSWLENISGTVSSSRMLSARGQTLSMPAGENDETASGSLSGGLSLLCLYASYSLNLTYSSVFNADANSEAFGVSLAWDF